MKILHIVAGDLTEGAARGAYWLHQGLRDVGVDSHVLTNSRVTFGDPSVTTTLTNTSSKIENFMKVRLERLLPALYRGRQGSLFSSGMFGVDFTKTQECKNADVIHLHWINNGFVNIKDIAKIDKPIVWTMRDMWPMTGGCHCAQGCDKYKQSCGSCIKLGSKKKHDLSRFILKRKKRLLPKSIKIVGVSNWISEVARTSAVFKDYDIRTIHNNINVADFSLVNPDVGREVLGIKTKKKIILVGSTDLGDSHKGFSKYLDALSYLDKDKYFLCFFGKLDESIPRKLEIEYKSFGYLHDTVSLRLLYSASDLFVAPSLMDAFGKTLAESMACGTPVVCFDATGPKDIVEHKVTGYKATPFDPEDLARGIEWVLNAPDYDELCANGRRKVEEQFDSRVVAEKYVELYKDILSS